MLLSQAYRRRKRLKFKHKIAIMQLKIVRFQIREIRRELVGTYTDIGSLRQILRAGGEPIETGPLPCQAPELQTSNGEHHNLRFLKNVFTLSLVAPDGGVLITGRHFALTLP